MCCVSAHPSLARRLLAPLAAGWFAGCAHAPPAALSDPALHGCWRHEAQGRLFADGRRESVPSPCTTEFSADEMRVRCPFPQKVTIGDFLAALPRTSEGRTEVLSQEEVQKLLAKNPRISVYRYRIDRPGHWVATMTESTMVKPLAPPREASYRLEGDRLEIALEGADAAAVLPGLVRLETLLVRTTGPEASGCLPPRSG